MNLFLVDLDNTLYSKNAGVFNLINVRIDVYMHKYLNIQKSEIPFLRKNYRNKFHSTLLGLIKCYNINPMHFLEYVHDIDLSEKLTFNQKLYNTIKHINAKKIIFTNAPHSHAENVLLALGIMELFDDIIDIIDTNFLGKPHIDIYQNIKDTIKANKYAMIDDLEENIIPAKAIGIYSILVSDKTSNIANITIEKFEDLDYNFIEAISPS